LPPGERSFVLERGAARQRGLLLSIAGCAWMEPLGSGNAALSVKLGAAIWPSFILAATQAA
jgi:hypothetical protein